MCCVVYCVSGSVPLWLDVKPCRSCIMSPILPVTRFAFQMSLSSECFDSVSRSTAVCPRLSPGFSWKLYFLVFWVCAFQQEHICMMFALVKCRLKPAQQDMANANIELEFPFCNRKPPLLAHNTGFPGFVLPPSGGWVFLRWDQTWWAEQRAAEEETNRSQLNLNLSAQETDENRHEGRQSFQVCYNLRCMILQFAETVREMQLTMAWVLLRWDLVFGVWCRVGRLD